MCNSERLIGSFIFEPHSQSIQLCRANEYVDWIRAEGICVYIFIPLGLYTHYMRARVYKHICCRLDRVHFSYFVTYLPRFLFRILLYTRPRIHSNLENMLSLSSDFRPFVGVHGCNLCCDTHIVNSADLGISTRYTCLDNKARIFIVATNTDRDFVCIHFGIGGQTTRCPNGLAILDYAKQHSKICVDKKMCL